jgi:hypothetical protein
LVRGTEADGLELRSDVAAVEDRSVADRIARVAVVGVQLDEPGVSAQRALTRQRR